MLCCQKVGRLRIPPEPIPRTEREGVKWILSCFKRQFYYKRPNIRHDKALWSRGLVITVNRRPGRNNGRSVYQSVRRWPCERSVITEGARSNVALLAANLNNYRQTTGDESAAVVSSRSHRDVKTGIRSLCDTLGIENTAKETHGDWCTK